MKCLSSQEIAGINRNYKDLLVCEKNYADLKHMYAQKVDLEEPFLASPSFLFPAGVLLFVFGFFAGGLSK